MDGATVLAIGAGIAGLTALLKSAFPDMPSRFIPLMVLGISTGFVGAAILSHVGPGNPLASLLQIVNLAAVAVGVREGVTIAIPQASALPSRTTSPTS